MKRLIALLAGLIFAIHLTSCTSKDSKDESSGDEAVAESTAGTDGDLESLDAPPAADAQASNGGASDGFLDEQLPEDALGESTKTAAAEPPPAADSSGDLNLDNSTTPPPTADAPPPAADSAASVAESTPPPPAEMEASPPPALESSNASVDPGAGNSFGSESSTASTGTVASTSSEPPAESKPKASLKKIESTPFQRGGMLLNAVYIARPKDDYKKIAKMIYGDSKKAKDLKKANPGISSPHPGDKIYYNSPARPTDDSKVATFYDDSGMSPEVYVTQEGEDLKKVSKKLLGYPNAWKEIWATNGIESKGALPAGTELRYWKSAPAPTHVAETPAHTETAMNNTPPPAEAAPPMPEMPPPPPPAEMSPPAPPQPVAQNEMPPPPPPAEMAPPPPPPAAEMPPPPPAEAVNPPPPPPMPKKSPKDLAATDGGLDPDTLMTLGGIGIILAAVVALIAIRRRRNNRDMANAFNDTQVGT